MFAYKGGSFIVIFNPLIIVVLVVLFGYEAVTLSFKIIIIILAFAHFSRWIEFALDLF